MIKISIEIKLKDNWYLRSDSRQYRLSQLTSVTDDGEKRWKDRANCTTLEHIFKKYKDFNLRESDSTSFKELLVKTQEINEDIKYFTSLVEKSLKEIKESGKFGMERPPY